jgi:LysW-gamma-L-lysine carboxypeptidase
MAALGFKHTYRDEIGNAIGVMGEGPRQIVLLGHIDTVPGEIPVQVEGGILYGRGSVDAKGSLAAFVDAVAAVGPVDGWQFVVIGAVDEERDSLGARHVVDKYKPDFSIIGEPSGWERITLGYKGSAQAKVTVRRSMAHTAARDKSAAEAAVDIWNLIQDWAAAFNRERPRAFEQVTPTLRGFASGEDGFETWASIQVGVRLPTDLPPETWYALLRELAKGADVQPRGYAIPAFRAQKRTRLVSAFLSGIRSAGGKPGFVVKTGTADLNIVAPVWGCPTVAYGPGDSTLDHTPNEHLSLDEYNHSVQVLVVALHRLTSHLSS